MCVTTSVVVTAAVNYTMPIAENVVRKYNTLEIVVRDSVIKMNNSKLMPFLCMAVCSSMLISLTSSCKKNDWKRSLSFPVVDYTYRFPNQVALTEGLVINLRTNDLLDVKNCKSIILISREDHGEGYLTGFKKNTFETVGSFINKGNGPNESINPVFFSDVVFEEESDQLYAYLYFRDKLHKINIYSSLDSNLLVVDDVYDTPNRLVCLKLHDNGYYTVSGYRDRSGFIRELSNAKIKDYQLLNDVHVSFRKDPNLVLFYSAYSESKELIIEASLFLNTINLYSTNGDRIKTICYGNRLESLAEKERLSEKEFLPKTFDGLRAYNNFFVCLYKGCMENYSHPHLLFFDYDGFPLIDVTIPSAVFSFDLDIDNKVLYVIDDTIDSLVTYDISSIVDTFLAS